MTIEFSLSDRQREMQGMIHQSRRDDHPARGAQVGPRPRCAARVPPPHRHDVAGDGLLGRDGPQRGHRGRDRDDRRAEEEAPGRRSRRSSAPRSSRGGTPGLMLCVPGPAASAGRRCARRAARPEAEGALLPRSSTTCSTELRWGRLRADRAGGGQRRRGHPDELAARTASDWVHQRPQVLHHRTARGRRGTSSSRRSTPRSAAEATAPSSSRRARPGSRSARSRTRWKADARARPRSSSSRICRCVPRRTCSAARRAMTRRKQGFMTAMEDLRQHRAPRRGDGHRHRPRRGYDYTVDFM